MTMHAKDPISWLTHFIGFIMAIIATPFIIVKAHIDTVGITFMVAVIIFMLNMMVLYAASSIYHYFNISEKVNLILKRIDHCSIFLLIAGTYTPVCLIAIRGKIGYTLLAIVWGIAIVGIILKALWVTCPKWVSSLLYIGMGWTCVLAFTQILNSLSREAFMWLLAGGLIYTIGGVIYALKLPIFNSRHKNFGSHEIFHLFVMGGSFCHFVLMYKFLAVMPIY